MAVVGQLSVELLSKPFNVMLPHGAGVGGRCWFIIDPAQPGAFEGIMRFLALWDNDSQKGYQQ